jgi:hypothetical protein
MYDFNDLASIVNKIYTMKAHGPGFNYSQQTIARGSQIFNRSDTSHWLKEAMHILIWLKAHAKDIANEVQARVVRGNVDWTWGNSLIGET